MNRLSTNITHLPTPTDLPINTFSMKHPLQATVLANTQLTAPARAPWNDTRHILIQTPGLSYVSGQSVGVMPPGIDPRTNRPYAMRLYSIASCGRGDDRKGDTLSLVVARHFWDNPETGEKGIPGVCSHFLCDSKPGDKLLLTGPVGKRFVLPLDFMERDFVFVATGTGVAPFRAMLADLFDQGYERSGRSVTLVLGVPFADSILYDNEFQAMKKQYANFTYVTAISRGDDVNPYPDLFPTRGNKVYAHIALWHNRQHIAPSLLRSNSVVYMCGLKGMETGVQDVIDHVGKESGIEGLSAQLLAEGRLLREVY